MYIDAGGTLNSARYDYPEKTDDDVVAEIITHLRGRSVSHISISRFSPYITGRLRAYKRAVQCFEKGVINPHTILGKKRLEREFELVIDDMTVV
jgi:hypothetical protein